MSTPTETITLRVHNFKNLSEEMLAAKDNSEVLKYWLGGQCWKWEGGESMTVMVGDTPWHLICYRNQCITTHVWGGSIKLTLESEFGVNVEVA